MTDAVSFLCVNEQATGSARPSAQANIVNGSIGQRREPRDADAVAPNKGRIYRKLQSDKIGHCHSHCQPGGIPAGTPVPICFVRFPLCQLPITIYANNEITCGNSYSTLWHITAYSDSRTPILGDYDYQLIAGHAGLQSSPAHSPTRAFLRCQASRADLRAVPTQNQLCHADRVNSDALHS